MTGPTPIAIKRQIDELVSKLIELGLSDDQNDTILRQTSATGYEITFSGSLAISSALKDREYEKVYQDLSGARAFNIKLLDGAIVQMMYDFKNGALLRHRLAFFPSPRLIPFQDDPDIYFEDALFADIIARRIVPFPFRFDYDNREGVYNELTHPKCHLTLGQYEDCRIPVTSPITPHWFIDFILRNFYHTAFDHYAEKLPAHAALFGLSIFPKEQGVIHVAAPFSGAA